MKSASTRVGILILVFMPLLFSGISPVIARPQKNEIVVNSMADAGPGTLRNALAAAPPGSRITFDPDVFPLNSPQVIYLTEELPPIRQGQLIIDASEAGVILDGSQVDVTATTYFDDVEFRINDQVVFSSNFEAGIENWRPEAIDSPFSDLRWQSEDSSNVTGSLAITASPEGNAHFFFYDEQAGKDRDAALAPDSTTWRPVTAGDSLSFSYRYRGARNFALIQALGNDSQARIDLEEGFFESESWQEVRISAIVQEGTYQVFPALRVESPFHGAGLFLASNQNEIYGLVIRNFERAIQIEGDENIIGEVTDTVFETCAGQCNYLESRLAGVFCAGSHNAIKGNWIGLDADSRPTATLHGVMLVWGGEAGGNEISGNWILPQESGIMIGSASETNVADNLIGLPTSIRQVDFAKGISLEFDVKGSKIGPNNRIFHAGNMGILLGPWNQDNLVFGNEILGSSDCGIYVVGTLNTTVRDNWIGVTQEGKAIGNGVGVCIQGEARFTQVGPGNIIQSNRSGIGIENAPNTQVFGNIIFRNEGNAVSIWSSAGDEPAAPTITGVSTTTLTVIGNADPETIVEIYFDEKIEGEHFGVSCATNRSGRFFCTVPKDRFMTDVNVTAISRDPDGGTSEFSKPFYLPTPDFAAITGIVGPLSLPSDPQVIGMSLVFAGLLLFIFHVLEEWATGLIEGLAQLDAADANQGKHRFLKWMIVPTQKNRAIFFLTWIILLVVIAFAQSMLEKHPLFSLPQLKLTGLLFLIAGILSLVEVGSEWITRKRWKTDCQFCTEIDLRGLLFVIGSVALSRLIGFSPGIIVGLAGMIYLLPDLNVSRKGPASLIVLGSIFAVSMAAWGLSLVFIGRQPLLETICLTLFFFGIQAVFFNLIPFESSNGRDILKWRKVVWLIFSLVCTSVFVYMIFMPAFTDVDAMRHNDYLTLYVIGGVLLFLAAFLWAAKKWRWFEKKKAATTTGVEKP